MALAESLRREGYDIFLDLDELAGWDELSESVKAAIHRTQRLVVIATGEALDGSSQWVPEEILLFSKSGRTLIPIVFPSSFQDSQNAEGDAAKARSILLNQNRLHVPESQENLAAASPDKEVIQKLITTRKIMRRRTLRTQISLGVITLLSIALLLVGSFGTRTELARRQEQNARKTAEQRLAQISMLNGQQAIERDEVAQGLQWYRSVFDQKENLPKLAYTAKGYIERWIDALPRYVLLHDDTIDTALLSPNGHVIYTETHSQQAFLWNAQTGKPLGQPILAETYIKEGEFGEISFSADSKLLATTINEPISGPSVVCLWDLSTGELHGKYPHPDETTFLRFSPDGKLLATAHYNTILIWDLKSGKLLNDDFILEDDWLLEGLEFNDQGSAIIASFRDDYSEFFLQAYDAETGETLWPEPIHHDGKLEHVHWVGQTIVAFSEYENALMFWDAQNRKVLLSHDYGEFNTISGVGLDRKNRLLGALDTDNNMAEIWNLRTMKVREEAICWYNLNWLELDYKSMAIFPEDGSLLLFDAQKWNHLYRVVQPKWLDGEEEPIFHDQFVLIPSEKIMLERHELILPEPDRAYSFTSRFTDNVFLNDNCTLVAAQDSRLLYRVDTMAGKKIHDPERIPMYGDILRVSQDGKWLAAAINRYGELYLNHLDRPQSTKIILSEGINDLAFTPTNHLITISGEPVDEESRLQNYNNILQVWDVQGHQIVGPILLDVNLNAMALTANGDRIALAHNKGISFLNQDYVPVGPLIETDAKHVAISPDGRSLASASDKALIFWDPETGRQQMKALAHNEIREMVYTQDGKTLIVSDAGYLQFWDVTSGQRARAPVRSGGAIALSPDGRWLAASATHIWDLERLLPQPQANQQHLELKLEVRTGKTIENGLIRNLSQAEWFAKMRQLDEWHSRN